ncbi:hypothetical protein ACQEVF_57765 [Nonomuraea polychroma]|uniref:hypothetical protein n=1 Tax=Nonomuraea polychroma TaxID=46176 RepID=UPI003D915150
MPTTALDHERQLLLEHHIGTLHDALVHYLRAKLAEADHRRGAYARISADSNEKAAQDRSPVTTEMLKREGDVAARVAADTLAALELLNRIERMSSANLGPYPVTGHEQQELP